jgi:hypothetical protein
MDADTIGLITTMLGNALFAASATCSVVGIVVMRREVTPAHAEFDRIAAATKYGAASDAAGAALDRSTSGLAKGRKWVHRGWVFGGTGAVLVVLGLVMAA